MVESERTGIHDAIDELLNLVDRTSRMRHLVDEHTTAGKADHDRLLYREMAFQLAVNKLNEILFLDLDLPNVVKEVQ